MDQEKFLKNFARLLGGGAEDALSKIEEKKKKEDSLLEKFSASLSKIADIELKPEDAIKEPITSDIKKLDEFIAKPVVEIPLPVEEIIEAPIATIEVPVVIANTASPIVVANTAPAEIVISKEPEQTINGALRKELDLIKKSFEDFKKLVNRQTQQIIVGAGSHGGGEVKLQRLDDVDYQSVKNAADGQVLTYNSTTKKWQAADSQGGGGIGYRGSVGYDGSIGAAGYIGSAGSTGYAGYIGSLGETGYAGSIGAPGYYGTTGDTGYSGSQGNVGFEGSIGAIGPSGYTGSVGEAGYLGSVNVGYDGSIGALGFQGSLGETGYLGSVNIGYKGSLGDPGGATGYQGSAGYIGQDGYTGSRGFTGYTGSTATANPSMPVRQNYISDGTSSTWTVDTGYTPGELDVYVNGIKVFNDVEVDVSSGTSFTLYYIPGAGQNIEVIGSYVFAGREIGYTGSRGYVGSAGGVITQLQSDWNQSNTAEVDFIKNKPNTSIDWLHVPSSIVPNTTNYYSLGNSSVRWESLWVGSNSVTFTDQVAGKIDQTLTVANGIFYITDSLNNKQQSDAGFRVGNFLFQNNYISLTNADSTFYIGTTLATGNVVFNRPVVMYSPDTSNVVFSVSRQGIVCINTPKSILTTTSAVSINGGISGYEQPRNFAGTLLQLTGQLDQPTRISLDSFGIGTYGLIAARAARGTVDTPISTAANDTLLRLTAQGWTNNTNQFIGSIVRMNFEAAQNFNSNAAGTKITFQTTPLNSNVIQTSATIDSSGLTTNNVTLKTITANGSFGANGQILVSGDGTSNVYWANVTSIYTPHYGSFYYAGANVALSSSSTEYIVPIANTASADGISTVSNNSIQFSQSGVYSFSYSIQYGSVDTKPNAIDIWLKKNTINLDDTNSVFVINQKFGSGSQYPGNLIATSPFIIDVVAGDKIQVMTNVHTGTDVSIITIPSQTNPTIPRTPAVIYTITQIR